MRALFFVFLMVAACSAPNSARAQQAETLADNVENGRHLAILMCSSCHVVSPDQLIEPTLRPAAPPFDSVAQRRSTTAQTIRSFLARHDAPKYRQPSRHAEPGTRRLPNKASGRLHFESAHAICGRRGSRAVCVVPGIMSRKDRAPGAAARPDGCATAAYGKRRGIIGRSSSSSAHRSIRRAGTATS